mmetsp:Transcript_23461/g.32901  ORF Transcript_23461/g.32901 Transcript_23461/m.32901 type:complete len:388 (-) Transcript_23461:110-1273(-)
MESKDNPYEILGVPRDATPSQIRSAYRKLALKHHPDKQHDETLKQQATTKFAKISNAYEVLSDPIQKQQFDNPIPQQQPSQARSGGAFNARDPFFTATGHHHHPFAFHDPFQVFEQVFGEEFGTFRTSHNTNGSRSSGYQSSQQEQFDDGFFSDPFMSRGFGGFGGFGGSLFGRDPFFGGGAFGGGHPGGNGGGGGDPFFGGGGRESMFSMMQRQMDAMHERGQIQQQQQQQVGGGGRGSGQSYSFSSFSSSSHGNFGGGANGESVSTSTTTRIINGKRQTVTEKTIRKADGTVERHVETTGDDDFPALQQQQQYASLPPSSLIQQQQQSEQAPSADGNNQKKRRLSLKNPLKRRTTTKKNNNDNDKEEAENKNKQKTNNDKPRSKY